VNNGLLGDINVYVTLYVKYATNVMLDVVVTVSFWGYSKGVFT
jgi:hypothetical protein